MIWKETIQFFEIENNSKIRRWFRNTKDREQTKLRAVYYLNDSSLQNQCIYLLKNRIEYLYLRGRLGDFLKASSDTILQRKFDNRFL